MNVTKKKRGWEATESKKRVTGGTGRCGGAEPLPRDESKIKQGKQQQKYNLQDYIGKW